MSLDEFRKQIDMLDRKLVRLLNRRAKIAKKIGEIKGASNLAVYSPSREREVYRRVTAANNGPMPDSAFRAIYREIMAATIALERCVRIAYLGPPGTFSHMAAVSKFGRSVEYVAVDDIRDVFSYIERERAEYGIVPVENSTEGGINATTDMLAETSLVAVSEVCLSVHHHLLCRGGMRSIRTVASHPNPLGQCRDWLADNLPNAQRKETSSTVAAVKLAASHKTTAAIASELAAESYSVPILHRRIEDNPGNTTRFLVLGTEPAEPTGSDKTSIMVLIKDEVGALHKMLAPFHAAGINLTRIESRPLRKRAWEYSFFIDFSGHVEDPRVKKVLEELEGRSRHVKTLGSYPAAPNPIETVRSAFVTRRKPGKQSAGKGRH